MPAEKGRNAALTHEPDPDNAGVGTPQKDPSRHGAWGAFFVASSPTNRRNEGMRNRKLQMLCEGAILVALAQILSMLKLWEMPWGGSITLGMLPIFLFAVRWGTRWGLVAGFAYGLLQVMFDGGFAISWQSILGDYLVAFTVLGLAGLGRGREKGSGPVCGPLGGGRHGLGHVHARCLFWNDHDLSLAVLPAVQRLLHAHRHPAVPGDLCPPLPAHA